MSDLFNRHPIAAWVVIGLVLWPVMTVIAIHVVWLSSPGTIQTTFVDMWKITATFFGLVIPAVLAGLWKLKGL